MGLCARRPPRLCASGGALTQQLLAAAIEHDLLLKCKLELRLALAPARACGLRFRWVHRLVRSLMTARSSYQSE